MLLAEIQGQEFVDILKMIAPGTQIREGLENILKAKTGGLIRDCRWRFQTWYRLFTSQVI